MRRVREEPAEVGSATSWAFLLVARQNRPPFFLSLLLVEVAAAAAPVLDHNEGAVALGPTVRAWPAQTLVPLDRALAERAMGLAARADLRGAAAVYTAAGQQ
jgi:hypothetical protein